MSNMRKVSRIVLWACVILLGIWESLLAGNNSGAAFSTWPDTGQTKCYINNAEIPCPVPGEPFYGQDAQYAGPARSYTVLGSGTMVQDNVTGLVWEMKNNMDNTPDYSNPNDADNTYTWCDTNPETNGGIQGTCGDHDTQDFIDQLNSNNFGGYSDWRMPTIKELLTLVDLGGIIPAIDSVFAATTHSLTFWSSTTRAKHIDYAGTVLFYHGSSSFSSKYVTTHIVRAVRGGQSIPENHYVDNGDGTVTDTVSCLQWQKATMDTNGDGTSDFLSWQQALTEVENLNLAGHSDWRLPNKNELCSLVDYSRTSLPVIDPVFAATTVPFSYWSSSILVGDNQAWDVDFGEGYNGWNWMTSGNFTRAVRGTQCWNPIWTPSLPMGRIYNSPMEGPPGTVFTQRGTGFTPNSSVTLHFRNQLGEELTPVKKTTDSSGAFSLTYSSPLDKPLGTHTWWVVDDTTGGMSERIGYLITGTPGTQTYTSSGTIINLEEIRINRPYGTLISEGTFDPDKETFVIVHGWNLPPYSNDTPPWMINMGKVIVDKGANVLYWNWQEKAKTKYTETYWDGKNDGSCVDVALPQSMLFPPKEITNPGQLIEIPFDEAKDSGLHLAGALKKALMSYDYNKSIHFIGHSLGTLVSTYAIQRAHDNQWPYAGLINHLVFLDSPCYLGIPGGKFLQGLKEQHSDFFWENYMSQVGRPYKDADVDVYLQPKAYGTNPLDNFTAHAYSHEWYRSSVTNFSDMTILGDSSTPSSTLAYGFYWSKVDSRTGVSSDYTQMRLWPHYLLESGTAWDASRDLLENIVVDLTGLYVDANEEIADQILDWAKATGKTVKIIGVKTYQTASDAAGYVTDTVGHAAHDAWGWITLLHSSTAVLDIPVTVPADASALTFGMEFLYGESGSMLEVFVNGTPVYHTTSDLALGEGLKMIPWINVEEYAGQTITISLRLSNPNEGTQGKIKIDDLIVAKIEDPDVPDGDYNNDGVVNLTDTILSLQVVSGQMASNKLYLKSDVNNDEKIGIEESIYSLQKMSGLK